MHVCLFVSDEIPQGLQLIANGAGHTLLLNGQKKVQKRVIISSIFRLIVGYLFLSSLFINIAQNIDVIAIFYDVLALEFVENIDDTAYALGESLWRSFLPSEKITTQSIHVISFTPNHLSQEGFLWKDHAGCNKRNLQPSPHWDATVSIS